MCQPSDDHFSPAVRWQVVWLRRVAATFVALTWFAALTIIGVGSLSERVDIGIRAAIIVGSLLLAGCVTLLWFLLLGPARRTVRVFTGAVVGVLVLALLLVFRLEEVDGGLKPRFVLRWQPKADRLLASAPAVAEASTIDLTTTTPNDFPQFLGPNRQQSLLGPELETDWERYPPKLIWRQPIGAGWSAFVAVNGYAVTQEQRDRQELITCYEVATGQLVWSNAIDSRHETLMGGTGPRSTPSIDEGQVYALGATGVLRCLRGGDGQEQWRHDLLSEQHVTDDANGVAWGRSGSPLIVGDRVIVPVGGPADGAKISLLAFDKRTGAERWRAGTDQVSYASPVLAVLHGQEQILWVAEDRLVSFAPEDGRELWSFPWPGSSTSSANASNPVAVDDQRVFLSKGYGQGACLVHVQCDANQSWRAESVWAKQSVMKTKFSNVVIADRHVFGLDDVHLECLDLATGDKVWKRGRYGYGQILRVGQTLLVLSEQGELAAVALDPSEYRELGRIPALSGKCWNNLCLYGDQLLVRNSTEAACFQLARRNSLASQSVTSE